MEQEAGYKKERKLVALQESRREVCGRAFGDERFLLSPSHVAKHSVDEQGRSMHAGRPPPTAALLLMLRMQAHAREAAQKAEAAAASRAAAIGSLAAMADEPHKVWQAAVDLVKKHIPSANVYVANIVDDEDADCAPGTAADGGADADADGAASDDEDGGAALLALLGDGRVGGGEGEDGEGGGEGEGEGADGAADGGAAGGGRGEGGEDAQLQPDYSSKLLSYVAASAGQEFMSKLELRRRPAAAAGGDEAEAAGSASGGAVTAPVPVTFRILDEHLPLLQVRAQRIWYRCKYRFVRLTAHAAAWDATT